jgi:molecular chaperone GrpE (heat shock protein)
MAEKFPNPQNKDQTHTQHTEQNTTVGKSSEWSTTGHSSSGKQPMTEEQKQKIREIYEQGKAIPQHQQSQPKLEEFRQRLQQEKQQELKDAVTKRDEASRKPSQSPSRPSLS